MHWATPGSYAQVYIHFDADDAPVSGVATVDASNWPHVQLPEEGSEFFGHDVTCRFGANGLITATLEDWHGDGVGPLAYCNFSVLIADDAPSTTVAIGFQSVSCLDVNAAALPCEGRTGTLFIDGPPTVAERSFLVLPHAPPRGPTGEVIDAFDPADPASPLPLQAFASPRPMGMRTNWRGSENELYFQRANVAALSMLNAMYVTYASIGERDAGLALARNDPGVGAVFPDGGMPPLYLYPELPRARQPLALYLLTGICEPYYTDDPDDREIEISGNTVLVYLPTDNDNLCGVPPPGSYAHILNLPGLAAGDYTLRVLSRPMYPGDEVEDRYVFDFTVAQGVPTMAQPREIPGPAIGWLIALALGLCVSARVSRQGRFDRSMD